MIIDPIIAAWSKLKMDCLRLMKPKEVMLTINSWDIGTVYRKPVGPNGEPFQRNVTPARLARMRPGLPVVLYREWVALLDNGDGTFEQGDCQARFTLMKEQGGSFQVKAIIYTHNDLNKAGLSIAEWVRVVSSDGNWDATDYFLCEPSRWKGAFLKADIRPAYNSRGSKLLVPGILNAENNARYFDDDRYPKTGTSVTITLDSWRDPPQRALSFCMCVQWWTQDFIPTAVEDSKKRPVFNGHRWLTFAYGLWRENNHKLLKSLGKYMASRDTSQWQKSLSGKVNIPRAYDEILWELNHGRRLVGNRVQILGSLGYKS